VADIGKIAYAAYAAAYVFDVQEWESLSEHAKNAWRAAAKAVLGVST
jgi:hypothetical protein